MFAEDNICDNINRLIRGALQSVRCWKYKRVLQGHNVDNVDTSSCVIL